MDSTFLVFMRMFLGTGAYVIAANIGYELKQILTASTQRRARLTEAENLQRDKRRAELRALAQARVYSVLLGVIEEGLYLEEETLILSLLLWRENPEWLLLPSYRFPKVELLPWEWRYFCKCASEEFATRTESMLATRFGDIREVAHE